jgi:hypothetical protein
MTETLKPHLDGLGEPFDLTRTLFVGNVDPLSSLNDTAQELFRTLNENTRNFRRLLFPPFTNVWDAEGKQRLQRSAKRTAKEAFGDEDGATETRSSPPSSSKVFCFAEWADKPSASVASTAMRAAKATLRLESISNKQAISLLKGLSPMVTPSFPIRPLLVSASVAPLSVGAASIGKSSAPTMTVIRAPTYREILMAKGISESEASSSSSSSAGGPAPPPTALELIKQAVADMSRDDLLTILGEVRAMATASVHPQTGQEDCSGSGVAAVRDLLYAYPSLTFALLFAEERLGILHEAVSIDGSGTSSGTASAQPQAAAGGGAVVSMMQASSGSGGMMGASGAGEASGVESGDFYLYG